MIEIRPLDPRTRSAEILIRELDAYQSELYPPDSNYLDPIEELGRPHVRFFGAYDGDDLVGCGCVKLMSGYGEIKRMYVRPKARGRGVGRHILLALESVAGEAGISVIRLETGVRQVEGARNGLQHNIGLGGAAVVTAYRKS